MKIGLGLPTSMAGVSSGFLLEWAPFGAARRYLENYYRNSPILPGLLADASTTPERVRETTDAFMRAGCNELPWFCCSPDPRQALLLEQALGGMLQKGAA